MLNERSTTRITFGVVPVAVKSTEAQVLSRTLAPSATATQRPSVVHA
jgi:hypothetical protein